MYREYILYGFYFDEDFAFYNQIRPKTLIHFNFIPKYWDTLLAFNA